MTGSVLVTGGTGTIGTALVRRLVADGRRVRVLARSRAAAETAAALGAEPHEGDVLDLDAVRSAASGCATVFHVAGRSGLCLRRADAEAMERVNLAGAATVVRAAAAAGAARLVHTSSASTIGEARGTVGDERTVHRGWYLSRYERSKTEAERIVLDLARDLELPVVCVNPASVQGPGRVDGSARILLDAVAGRFPVLVDTWLSLVDVEDCADGHLRAERDGVPGQRYVLCGASISTRQAMDLLRDLWGLPGRVRWIPGAALVPVGAVTGIVARLGGPVGRACPEAIATLRHGHRYDGSRATRDLGVTYTPLRDTLGSALRWYAERGLVPPARAGSDPV